MTAFSPSEVDEIDALWRSLPPDHMWTGWAAAGESPDQIWIFRTRRTGAASRCLSPMRAMPCRMRKAAG
jgi:hypothetical protein